MSDQATTLDPISLEIIGNGLRSITDECFAALMLSAYSTNIKSAAIIRLRLSIPRPACGAGRRRIADSYRFDERADALFAGEIRRCD